MPNRIIRDGILFSIPVSRLSPQAELLYRKLLSVVDDFGRYYAYPPEIIMSSCYPLQVQSITTDEIAAWLTEIETNGLINVYESDGKRVLEIVKFNQRQRASKSKFPAPDEGQDYCHTNVGHKPVSGTAGVGRVLPEYEDEDESEDVVVKKPKTKTTAKKKKTKPLVPLPDDWKPNESHEATALDEKVDIVRAAKVFRYWATDNGIERRDWNATFRNALMNREWMGAKAPLKNSAVGADGKDLKRIVVQ